MCFWMGRAVFLRIAILTDAIYNINIEIECWISMSLSIIVYIIAKIQIIPDYPVHTPSPIRLRSAFDKLLRTLSFFIDIVRTLF